MKLSGVFGKISPFKALVLGDFLLDTYTTGKVKRVSPEAPVPVLEVTKYEMRAGGAGNVVLNLLALGAEVYALGRIGSDGEGSALQQALSLPSVHLELLVKEAGYKTPVKNRLIAESQQLLRVDREEILPLQKETEDYILASLENVLSQVDVVAISDYGKGFLSSELLSKVFFLAKKRKIPTVVDPKGLDFSKYQGATVLKPNASEAYAAAKLPLSAPLREVAQRLFREGTVENLLITRSEAGISLFTSIEKQSDFPVRSREVKDVTGAGDTVLAMIALALAHRLDLSLGAELANVAAGIAIERLGCVQVTLRQLAERLLEIDCDMKVFDERATYALKKACEGKKISLLGVETKQELGLPFFQALQALRKDPEKVLIVYLPDADHDFIHLLSSLPEVDFIVLQREGLKQFCAAIQPEEISLLQNGALVPKGSQLLAQLLEMTPPPRHTSPT